MRKTQTWRRALHATIGAVLLSTIPAIATPVSALTASGDGMFTVHSAKSGGEPDDNKNLATLFNRTVGGLPWFP